jgi:hypothetical protein
MPALTRRREKARHQESWQVYYGDVRIGWIGERAGAPKSTEQWGWCVGFHPRDRHVSGTAGSLDQARREFEAAWRDYLPSCTDADFNEYRRQRAWSQWKYEMQEKGFRLPTQMPDLRSRCICGAEIGVAFEAHVYASHMEVS